MRIHPMSELFRAITERLKAIFAANAALELEAELLVAHIERKTALLRLAAQCAQEGFEDLAEELRNYIEGMNPRQPATAILPTNLGSSLSSLGAFTPAVPEHPDGKALPLPAMASDETSGECRKR